jgi:putative peptidoglycan lipid II flippase
MRALFARGAFGVQAADTAAMALFAYALGLPAFVLLRCIVMSFYARGDTATPVRATILGVIANIAVKLILVWGFSFGVMGIALGTSFGAWVNLVILVVLARRRGVLVGTAELKRAAAPVAIIVGGVAAAIFAGVEIGAVILDNGAILADEGIFLFAFFAAILVFTAGVYTFRNQLPLREAIRTRNA